MRDAIPMQVCQADYEFGNLQLELAQHDQNRGYLSMNLRKDS